MLKIDNEKSLSDTVDELTFNLQNYDISIVNKKEIQYGVKLNLVNSNTLEEISLNIYSGKKGLSFVPSNKNSKVYKDIRNLLEELTDGNTYKGLSGNIFGTDESGKGDYFGPLVIAGFFTNEKIKQELEELGVRDCKKIPDKNVIELYNILEDKYPKNISKTIIKPEKYNEMYSRMRLEGKKLNHLLAWGHANTIELNAEKGNYIDCVISDQFGDSQYLTNCLYEKGQKLKVIQNIRAENNTSVAAASIIARAEFLKWIYDTSKRTGYKIPKGASDSSIDMALYIIKQNNITELKKFVKLHFKNTKEVLQRLNSSK